MNKTKIQKIYRLYKVPKHVIAHMEAVAAFAEKLCARGIKRGLKINKKLVLDAALLHDALRVVDFRSLNPQYFRQKVTAKDLEFWETLRKKYGKIGHVQAIKKALTARGEKSLAELIEKHDFLLVDKLETLEEKILYYSDKRIEGDKIVALKQRFENGAKRNAGECENSVQRRSIERKVLKLEKELIKIGCLSVPKY